MSRDAARLFPFQANGQKYIYSGYTGLLVRSSEELETAIHDPTCEAVDDLFGMGETSHKPPPPPDATPLQNITVFTTNRCNLNCSYCYERANDALDGANMSLQTFKSGIDFFLSRFETSRRINVLFFGGEPLMNMGLVRGAVHHLENIGRKRGIAFGYSVTTNGTVMDENVLDFLLENDFSLVVSVDGSKESHDRNRPFVNGTSSYPVILRNVRRASQYMRVVARVTLTDLDTDLVKLYEELKAAGFWEVHVTIVAGNGHEHDGRHLSARIGEMERHFLRNIAERRVVRYSDLLKYLKLIHFGWRTNGNEKVFPCMAGYSSFSLAVNGDIFVCHRFNNVEQAKLGNIREGIHAKDREQFLVSHHVSQREGPCRSCWAAALCGGTCYHAAFAAGGATSGIDELQCLHMKALLQSALNIYVSLTPEQRLFLERVD